MVRFRFEALDGMRGLAALAVLLFHVYETEAPWVFPHGYLAVDFFFILSGFVIAYAYERRLLDGLMLKPFVYARFVRLYPLIVAGAVVGVVGCSKLYDRPTLGAVFIAGLLLLPTPFAPQSEDRMAMSVNPPSWSLFFEFAVNVTFALAAPRMSNRALLIVVAIAALALAGGIVIFGGADFGARWPDFWAGTLRVCFSFFAGVGLFRLWREGRLARFRLPFPILLASLTFLFLVPDRTASNCLFDAAAILLAFPLIVACGTNVSVSTISLPYCLASGALSYPVYVLQGGIAPHIRDFPGHFGIQGVSALAIILSLVTFYVLVCWISLKVYDEPIRRFLIRRNRERSVQIGVSKSVVN